MYTRLLEEILLTLQEIRDSIKPLSQMQKFMAAPQALETHNLPIKRHKVLGLVCVERVTDGQAYVSTPAGKKDFVAEGKLLPATAEEANTFWEMRHAFGGD